MFGVINVVMQGWTRNVFSRGVAGRGGAGQGQKPGQGRGLNLQSLFFSGSLTFAQESLGGKPGVYFVIVCSSTNHNINDFAQSPRSQNHIF